MAHRGVPTSGAQYAPAQMPEGGAEGISPLSDLSVREKYGNVTPGFVQNYVAAPDQTIDPVAESRRASMANYQYRYKYTGPINTETKRQPQQMHAPHIQFGAPNVALEQGFAPQIPEQNTMEYSMSIQSEPALKKRRLSAKSEKGKKRNSEDATDDARRKEFLQRNREAASKCRDKKREKDGRMEAARHVEQLKNDGLRLEVAMLLDEVYNLQLEIIDHVKTHGCSSNELSDWCENRRATFDRAVFRKIVDVAQAAISKPILEKFIERLGKEAASNVQPPDFAGDDQSMDLAEEHEEEVE